MTTSEKLARHRHSQLGNDKSGTTGSKNFMSQMMGQSYQSTTHGFARQTRTETQNGISIRSITQSLFGTQRDGQMRSVVSMGACQINGRAVRKFGSVKAILQENERMQQNGVQIIHPYSSFRLIWDFVTLILLMINVFAIPVFMAFPVFDYDSKYGQQGEVKAKCQLAALIIKVVSDAFFATDIVLSFRTGLLQEGADNEVIIDPKKIRRAYIRKWFWLDMISTIPLDTFVFAIARYALDKEIHSPQNMSFLRYIRLTKLFQLLRLLRLTRLVRSRHQWEELFSFPYDGAMLLIRIFCILFSLLTYAHISACLQFMVPMILDFPHNSWVVIRNLQYDTLSRQYGWSLFRSISQMLCIGYGLAPPASVQDMYVVTILMMLGAICFALYIGYTTSILQSHNASKRLYTEKYSSIKQYMLFRKLPMELRRRIADYYENRYQGKMFNESQILKELNPILREELINHNCRELVDAVPFFTEADPEFVSTVVTYLKFEVYLYGDEIIRQGTIGRKMYFISRGTVRIVNHRDRDISKSQTLSDGEFFGEISIVLPTKRRVASVFADSYCYLYSLSVEDFNRVLSEFPMQRKHFMKEAAKRLENMREEDKKEFGYKIGGDKSVTSVRKWYKKATSLISTTNRLRKTKKL